MSEREILFRGKRADNGEWIEGYFLPGNERQSLHPCIFVYLPETQSFECFDIDIDTLGEYTTVKDKKGTRIFEGDVIKHRGENFIVHWDEECAGFYPFYDQDNPIGYGVIGEESEVIGNVHDNPELRCENGREVE